MKTGLFNSPENLEYHASCADGLDEFLNEEALSFRLKVHAKNRGGIFFTGKKENLKNFFLSTRFSSRVSFSIKKFKVRDADDLYAQAVELPWEKFFSEGMRTFKIDSYAKDALTNSRYAMYRLKDAIKDRCIDNGIDTGADTENPDYTFLLRSSGDYANIQLSLSGLPLNKRGYRVRTVEAPLRENIAQALLFFSGWKEKDILIDPMCGSGTILIEAALIIKKQGKINTNLLKNSPVFSDLFGEIKDSDHSSSGRIQLFGSDIDPKAVEIARENAEKAGVGDMIEFSVSDFFQLERRNDWGSGFIVTNPPYGERLSDKTSVKELFFQMGNRLKKNFANFSFSLICGDKSLLGHLKLKADRDRNIAIAGMKGKLCTYTINEKI
ncbi:MAG TPA: N-6 DNA methylase [Leptospiraceae bacterium]|nr:N-6 DNA methylase [Leptospiraceae bacterium]HNF13536.1 N-6 DNA methylase [Leptospiraceae bacterium]HNF27632.1 N-6 DNA methylase [Leptospiraceae bacterium]HNI96245.1 N-6 DNA methylase [Leptospiraceae bacterium]